MKLLILARMDLKIPKDRIAYLISCAEAKAANDTAIKRPDLRRPWKTMLGMVNAFDELNAIRQKCDSANILCHEITDVGILHVESNELACIAVGPDEDEKIDHVVGDIKL